MDIKYWLDGGTLLGAIRCKPAGVISHGTMTLDFCYGK